jgi:hypothetical protein
MIMTRAFTVFAIIVLGFLVLAQSPQAIQAQDPTQAATMAATQEALTVGNGWTLTSRQSTDESTDPALTVTISQPVLSGPVDPRIEHFNKAVEDILTQAVELFKKDLRELGTPEATIEPSLPGSTIEITYTTFVVTENLISTRFDIFFYATGAAHPNTYSVPLNFDVRNDKILALADLFQPKAEYLKVLSTYCADALKKADVLIFPEGVEPKEENFRSWNITPTGLQITFDVYQIAPYAAGPQYVLVPYSLLKSIIDPKGPIAEFAE